MDINLLRGLVTVASFAAFAGIALWAYSGRARAGFEEAAMLPFTEPDGAAADEGVRAQASQARR